MAAIQKYSFGEPIGVKDRGMLESAVSRPQSSALEEGADETIFEKAAALFESISQNHPFHNANKRTAFTALVIFLKLNGYHFVMEQKAAENFTVDMVNHRYTFEGLTAIIQQHSN